MKKVYENLKVNSNSNGYSAGSGTGYRTGKNDRFKDTEFSLQNRTERYLSAILVLTGVVLFIIIILQVIEKESLSIYMIIGMFALACVPLALIGAGLQRLAENGKRQKKMNF